MPVLIRLIALLYNQVVELRAWVIGLVLLGYLAISWVLFALAGEQALTRNVIDFLYFAMTTASTVGYGDMSPATPAGRLVAAVWFFPGALLIFTAVLGKITSVLVEGVRRMAEGRSNFENVANATVIIGFHAERTDRMVRDMLAGEDGDDTIIVLSRKTDIGLPDGVRLVRSDRLDGLDSLRRAGVPKAAKVLVYADTDAETFNACLAVREINPTVHVAAYFDDRDTAGRAARFANVEPVISHATEILVRAAQDPGSSRVLSALSSAVTSSTIFSGAITNDRGASSGGLREALLAKHATMVAVSTEPDAVAFAPFPDRLGVRTVVYYIAGGRLDESTWKAVLAEAE